MIMVAMRAARGVARGAALEEVEAVEDDDTGKVMPTAAVCSTAVALPLVSLLPLATTYSAVASALPERLLGKLAQRQGVLARCNPWRHLLLVEELAKVGHAGESPSPR
jgi:hypothetical protein